TLGVMAPVWGILSDRFSRKAMILRATGAGVLTMILMSLATDIWFVFMVRTVQGAFTGTVTAAAALVAAGTPNKRLPYAIGLITSSTFIGNTLGPFIGGYAAEWFGYRMSFFLGSGILLAGFLLVLFAVKDIPPHAADTDDAEGMAANGPLHRKSMVFFILINLLLLFIIRFASDLTREFLAVLVQGFLGTVTGAASYSGNLLGVIGLFSAIVSVLFGRLGEKHNKILISIIMIAVGALCNFLIFSFSGLLVFTILYPIARILVTSVNPLVMAMITAVTPGHRRGFLFGVQTAVTSAAWAIAPLVATAVSINISNEALLLATAVTLVLSLPVALLAGFWARQHREKTGIIL
ncbi:MAG: MFS transporter, partial [Spirochaetaceae bacterium]